MRNQTAFRHVGSVSPQTWQGFTDARGGRGFPKEYDSWKEYQQGNYERGRLTWVNIQLAGLSPPDRPSRLPKIRKRAIELVGSAVPPQRPRKAAR